MTRQQRKILNELKEAFRDVADEIEVVAPSDSRDTVKVFMNQVSSCCKFRRSNKFTIGPRGGLKVVKQEFNAIGSR
jgi:hypothetical protein